MYSDFVMCRVLVLDRVTLVHIGNSTGTEHVRYPGTVVLGTPGFIYRESAVGSRDEFR